MRRRMQNTASEGNIKRGLGGTVDIEFIVQMLQLRHAAENSAVLVPGTFQALERLLQFGYMGEDDFTYFNESYRFLRSVEARLRLMNTTARHDLPENESDLAKLAYLLSQTDPQTLLEDCHRYRAQNRERFNRLFDLATQ